MDIVLFSGKTSGFTEKCLTKGHSKDFNKGPTEDKTCID